MDAGGHRLHLHVTGTTGEPRGRPTVILAAGIGSCSAHWAWVQAELAPSTRVVALTSVLVAVAVVFPAADLFEGGRGTVWAPALLHFAAHLPKLAEPAGFTLPLQLAWSVAVLALPYLAFAFRLRAPPPGSPDTVPQRDLPAGRGAR